jgi:hypothetical protein
MFTPVLEKAIFVCLLALSVTSCGRAPQTTSEEMQRDDMSESVEIELSGGKVRVSVEDLKQIKQELLAVLKQPARDYTHLIAELTEHSAPMILSSGHAAIGSWKLVVRNKSALLQRQQMPRARFMLFYEAPLVIENGRWRVTDVEIVTVHGK